MRIPVMLADYPDWMFTRGGIAAGIAVPALFFLLAASAARLKQNVGLSRGLFIAAGVWVASCVALVLFVRIILRLV